MFRRADLVDLYALADPTKCRRYVVVGADALDSLFVRLRLFPKKGKDGILYFQSIDGLLDQRAIPPAVRQRQQQYCNELSFFFIRIFQVFGALYLSMIDGQLPLQSPPDEIVSQREARAAFLRPDNFFGLAVRGPTAQRGGALSELASRSAPQQGGALSGERYSMTDENYKILNRYLNAPTDREEPLKFSSYSLYIPQQSLYNFAGDTRTPKATIDRVGLEHKFQRGSGQIAIRAELQLRFARPTLEVSLENFQLSTGQTRDVRITRQLTATGDFEPTYQGPIQGIQGATLPAVLVNMFQEVAMASLGKPAFSVIQFLQGMRLVGYPNANGNMPILGTQIYIPAGEGGESVTIRYANYITVGEGADRSRRQIIISASLTISDQGYSAADMATAYQVRVSFTNSVVRPQSLESAITLPSADKTERFYARPGGVPRSKRDQSIPDFLKRIFENILENKDDFGGDSGIRRTQFTREGFAKPLDSQGIPEPLRIRRLWEAMAKDPPIKAHCIARATQLLSVAAIRGDMSDPAYTSICRMNFGYVKDGSLPKPGESITSSVGINALITLFYDELQEGSPKILNRADYDRQIRYLKFLFEDRLFTSPEQTEAPQSASQIRDTRIPVCQTTDAAISLKDRKPLTRSLQAIAVRMVQQQRQHVSRAMDLIYQLFDPEFLNKKKGFALHPRIMEGAMDEVNRIAARARSLLLEYYRGCETKYKEGLLRIHEENRSRPLLGESVAAAAVQQPRQPVRPAPSAPPEYGFYPPPPAYPYPQQQPYGYGPYAGQQIQWPY